MGALQAEVRLHLQTVSPRNWYSPFLCLLGCSKIVLIETYLKRRGGREREVCVQERTRASPKWTSARKERDSEAEPGSGGAQARYQPDSAVSLAPSLAHDGPGFDSWLPVQSPEP